MTADRGEWTCGIRDKVVARLARRRKPVETKELARAAGLDHTFHAHRSRLWGVLTNLRLGGWVARTYAERVVSDGGGAGARYKVRRRVCKVTLWKLTGKKAKPKVAGKTPHPARKPRPAPKPKYVPKYPPAVEDPDLRFVADLGPDLWSRYGGEKLVETCREYETKKRRLTPCPHLIASQVRSA